MFSMDIISSFELKYTIFLLFSYTFYLLMMNNRKKLSETAIRIIVQDSVIINVNFVSIPPKHPLYFLARKLKRIKNFMLLV